MLTLETDSLDDMYAMIHVYLNSYPSSRILLEQGGSPIGDEP